MAKKASKRSLGKELNARLQRFTTKLKTTNELSQSFTCRTLTLALKPQAYSPAMVKGTRELLRVSQPIFAQFLGVSATAVRDWEQGLKPPRGAACRLMDEIRQNPSYFQQRLRELSQHVQA